MKAESNGVVFPRARLEQLRDAMKAAEGGDGAVSLGDAIAERMAAPVEAVSIAARLERKFGLGQDPKKRRELFRRLQVLIELKGDQVYVIVDQVVAESVGSKRPDRYFAFTVIRRLREAGFGLGAMPGGDPSW